jgi:L-lactate dehydrogenase complex protein LldG
MTADERLSMRARIAAALKTATLPGASPDHPGALRLDPAGLPDPKARFTGEITALGGFVHDATSADEVVSIIAPLVAAAGHGPVLMWDDQYLPMPGVAEACARAGLAVDRQHPGDLGTEARKAELERASVGVTGADAWAAETGSLVLASGPGRGRLASLLPPIHVALVTRAQQVSSFQALLAARPELVAQGANLVCITGPSRTADIELTLSRGVHGPREVHVIFCG